MKIKLLSVLLASSFLVACGGSSSDPAKDRGKGNISVSSTPVVSSLSSAQSSQSLASSEPDASSASSAVSDLSSSSDESSQQSSVVLLQGVFIDAPVANIRYTTTSRTDADLRTTSAGVFEYVAGDEITFYIGGVALPKAIAGAEINPLTLANTDDYNNQVAVNIARLLQSIDKDGLPYNGIQIDDDAVSLTAAIDFTLSDADFANDPNVIALLQALNPLAELVSRDDALKHLSNYIDIAYTVPSTLDCTAITSYYCDDFTLNANNWTLLPSTDNTTIPDGKMLWEKVDGNGMLRHTAASKGGVVALLNETAMANVPSADYAVEARFRPRVNGTTGNKQLYLITRYVDGNNWYAGVLNVQNDPASTNVEIAKMTNGSISRPKQIRRPIHMGAQGATDGVWYELRVEHQGKKITVYLDGEFIAEWEDPTATFDNKGTIGLWTANKSFEFDDVRIVNVDTKPVSLTIAPSTITYAAEANDDPKVITVTATKADLSPDTFTVASSNTDVVRADINGNTVSLVPLSAGKATITFASTTNPDRTRIIQASISPEFVFSSETYDLTGKTVPVIGEENVYEDQQLRITFDEPVVLGSVGLVRIFDAADDSRVDSISLINEKDTIGYTGSLRTINTRQIVANGNDLIITPHANVLKPGKTYWVAFGENLIGPNKISGKVFNGLASAAGWQFTTRTTLLANDLTSVIVDDNGTDAHFRSVQSALNYAMKNSSVTTISIKDGVYQEPLYLRNRNNLSLVGESRDHTILQYPNNEKLNSGSSVRTVFLVEGSDMLTLENLTLKNTTLIGAGGQAETIYFNNDNGRLIAKNANFISEQDTLLLKGWTWFYNTLVAGNVDFIWGYSKASLFEKSEIRTLGRSTGNNNGGYILQARVTSASDKGFVFLNSRLTSGAGPTGELPIAGSHYLARSSGEPANYDNIVFVNSKMDSHINPLGWAGLGVNNQPVSNPSSGTATTGWREFGTMDTGGNSVSLTARQFGYEMSLTEVMNGYCSRAQVFAAFNSGEGWNPLPSDTSDCVDVEGVNPPSSSSVSSSSVSSENQASSAAPSSDASSSVSSEIVGGASSSDVNSSSSAASSAATSTVLSMNFATLGSSTLVDNTETTLANEVDAPVVTNTAGYAVKLIGKLKISMTQGAPSGADGSTGVLQFGNNTASVGKLIIKDVQCPFTLQVKHAPSSTNDVSRKLRITVGGTEVYLQGDGGFQTADVTPSCTGNVDVEAYGWDGTQGKGVRIFDLNIIQ